MGPGNHRTIQRHGPAELRNDSFQDFHILHLRIRIISRHHTALAKLCRANQDGAHSNLLSRPIALLQIRHAADHDVGPKTTTVNPQPGDGAICRYQQRKHVESLGTVCLNQMYGATHSLLDHGLGFRCVPVMTVDSGSTLWIERATQPQELRIASSGHNMIASDDNDLAIMRHPKARYFRGRELFPTKLLTE